MSLFTEPLAFRVSEARPLSEAFFRRLSTFYCRPEQQEAADSRSPSWQNARFVVLLTEALRSGDPARIAEDLGQLYDGLRVIGLDWGTAMLSTELEPQCHAQWEWHLVSAANNLGALAVRNPEQVTEERLSPAALLARIEGALGCRLDHPGGGRLFGADIEGRLFPRKLLDAAVIASSLTRLPGWPPPAAVLEIGAGCGFLCQLIQRLPGGPFPYHIIDLPEVTVMQAYLMALGGLEERLWLAGEAETEGRTLFLHGLAPPAPVPLGVVLNQDSLPEILPEAAARYLGFAVENLRPGGTFFSVNHESGESGQGRVFAMMQSHRSMALRHRSPSWVRPGYVEEVWVKR